MDKNSMFVLWWQYSDHTGTTIVRVYQSESRANEDYDLVKDDPTKTWYLDEVPML